MRLALIGFGGVGKAFLRLLQTKRESLLKEGIDAKVTYILASRGGLFCPEGVDTDALFAHLEGGGRVDNFPGFGSPHITPDYLAQNPDGIDVAIDLLPTNKATGQPGLGCVDKLLDAGVHVILADKGPAMLACHDLARRARARGVQLGLGCTTGGALPSINGGIMDLAGAEIQSIEGVLNGTTNFIIQEMEQSGCTYEQALKKAQDCGIAETDPSLDVEGWDTAGKLLILTNVLMKEHKTLDDISVTGITGLTPEQIQAARAQGKKYKLLGSARRNERGELEMTVSPCTLSGDHPLFSADGKNKAVRYTSDTLGDLTVMGGASGTTPAAASVLRDLVNIHRGYHFV